MGVKRKSDFGTVRAAFDPKRTLGGRYKPITRLRTLAAEYCIRVTSYSSESV